MFDALLPALTAAGLRYWVYGGVGVAGVVGEFFRTNGDVDVYVAEADYAAARAALLAQGSRLTLTPRDRNPARHRHGRPKFELLAGEDEILSLVPVYPTAHGVEFRGARTPFVLPDAFVDEQNHIDNYHFTSPPADTIKRILRNFLEERSPAGWGKRRKDAERLFPAVLAEIKAAWMLKRTGARR